MAHIIPHAPTKKKQPPPFITGKRKTSIARVRLSPGEGRITVNGRPLEQYFGRLTLRMIAQQAFEATGTIGKFDAEVDVEGGGLAGQAGAVRHAIARALLTAGQEFRKPLKGNGYLTRDAREKERRKVGRRKARRRPQYSKR